MLEDFNIYTLVIQIKKDDSINGNTGKFSHLQITTLANFKIPYETHLQIEKKVKGGHYKIKLVALRKKSIAYAY